MVRIVSLLASATEMVAALGCLDQLVGRSHECDYPPDVLALPQVSTVQIDVETTSEQIDAQIKQLAQTHDAEQPHALRALSLYQIDVALLRRLQPDVVLTQTQCEVCAVSERDVVEALRQVTGLHPRIVSLAPYRLSDVWEDVVRVGKALARQHEAGELVKRGQQRLAQLAERTAHLSIAAGKRPSVAVLEWLDPLMGAGNWVPELVEAAGGEHLVGETGLHSPWLTWEELQAKDPEVLILCPCGFSLARTHLDLPILQRHPAWHQLQAVRNGRVYVIDGNAYLNRSGPRLVESAELLAYVIWGEQLGLDVDQHGWQTVQASGS